MEWSDAVLDIQDCSNRDRANSPVAWIGRIRHSAPADSIRSEWIARLKPLSIVLANHNHLDELGLGGRDEQGSTLHLREQRTLLWRDYAFAGSTTNGLPA